MPVLMIIALLFLTVPAWAHKPSDSYLSLSVQHDQIIGQWDIALRDLDNAIGVDGDGDGQITWGEIRSKHDAISDYTLSRLTLSTETSVVFR